MDKIILIMIVVISLISNSKSYINWSNFDYSIIHQTLPWYSVFQVLNTDNNTDFRHTFSNSSGHLFGVHVKKDFTMEIFVEANFTTQYDQAGLMIYLDEKHWLTAGIEYIDGQPMIGSVLTNGVSDFAMGLYTGDPRKVWLRLSKVRDVIVVKYSTDNSNWHLLRMSPFPVADSYFVGPMCSTPTTAGLGVKFSGLNIVEPAEEYLI